MPITTQDPTNQNPQQQATGNGNLPEAPTFTRYNPFTPHDPNDTSTTGQIIRQYQNSLGRDPTRAQIDYWRNQGSQQGRTLGDILNSISGSTEAQRSGRARAEVGSLLNSQIGQVERETQLARQQALEEMANVGNYYGGQLANLDFQRAQQETTLDQALRKLMDESAFSGQRLQEQVNPAILAARSNAARSGLLNSTIMQDRVNQGLNPIFQGMADLQRQTASKSSDIEQQRADLINRYLQQTTQAKTEQGQQEKLIRDNLALLYSQAGGQAGDILGSFQPSMIARRGEIGDQFIQQQLAQRSLQEQIAARLAENKISYADLAERRRQFDISQ